MDTSGRYKLPVGGERGQWERGERGSPEEVHAHGHPVLKSQVCSLRSLGFEPVPIDTGKAQHLGDRWSGPEQKSCSFSDEFE